MQIEEAEKQARDANSPEKWDTLWQREGQESWRGQVLETVYARVLELLFEQVPKGSKVLDVGGGVGIFAKQLRDKGCEVTVWDISPAAVEMARAEGLTAHVVDVESEEFDFDGFDVVISTECLEHLSQGTRDRVLAAAAKVGKAFFTVPNDRLGPEVEPQHTIQFTAMSFKRQIQKHFEHVRVEVVGPCEKPFVPAFLLGVCGFKKSFTLSFTMPVRNEEKDIERVLASFRAAADEIVIGIDYRSTDKTWEIAEKYADVVFSIDDPQGPPDDLAPKVHFGHIRNRCLDKCTGDWIFMSEGHESLKKGTDTLLHLDQALPPGTRAAYVWRTGQGQRWGFPWLTIGHDSRFRYTRSTHNDLTIPPGSLCVKLPQVETWHFRDHAAELARKEQRKVQNRVTLMDDWVNRGSNHSLFYLASEWREFNQDKALEYFKKFIDGPSKIGDAKYQSRLIVAKEHAIAGLKCRDRVNAEGQPDPDMLGFTQRMADARAVLLPATGDNWCRTEHWLWLGDIAAEQHLWDEALQFYRYAATQIGNPPFILWWIDDDVYGHLPAQRLGETYANLGRYEESLYWARQVLELLPEGSPEELVNEATAIIQALEEELRNERS
jgi:SAM-dependent methyltransferase